MGRVVIRPAEGRFAASVFEKERSGAHGTAALSLMSGRKRRLDGRSIAERCKPEKCSMQWSVIGRNWKRYVSERLRGCFYGL